MKKINDMANYEIEETAYSFAIVDEEGNILQEFETYDEADEALKSGHFNKQAPTYGITAKYPLHSKWTTRNTSSPAEYWNYTTMEIIQILSKDTYLVQFKKYFENFSGQKRIGLGEVYSRPCEEKEIDGINTRFRRMK